MSTIEETKRELQDVEILRGLSSALLEIASIQIRSLRESFETNKVFYEDVSDLYRLVKLSAKKRNYREDREIDSGREMHVAVTSNKRFYGALNRTVMDSFVGSIEEGDKDFLIIGYTGKHLVENTEYQKYCGYLSFKNDYPIPKEMEVFLERVRPYGKVILYYPKFVNIFRQDPILTDITYTTELDEIEVGDNIIEQIYEPELPHILTFFESQVRRLLFTRIMLESELSRTAARLVKMNSTEDRAEVVIKQKKQDLRKETMVLEDIRLLETFSSRVSWRRS